MGNKQLSMDITFKAREISIFPLETGVVSFSKNTTYNLLENSLHEEILWKGAFWNYFYECLIYKNPILVWTQTKIDKKHFLKWINYCQRKKHLPKSISHLIEFENIEDQKQLKEIYYSLIEKTILAQGYNSQYYLRLFECDQNKIKLHSQHLSSLAETYAEFNYLIFSNYGPEMNLGRQFPVRMRTPGSHIQNQLRLF